MIRFAFLFLLSAGIAWGQGSFIFSITADSHLDEHTDRELYQRTLRNAAADKPVFHIDLGDTFMSEKHTNRTAAAQQYLDQRRYFDLLHVPVHLVQGNHDGESGRYLDGTDGFKEHRPGWPLPIHPLLVRNHVNIVFHGHDHLYAKQDLDGIVYQEVLQPGDPKGSTRSAAEYSYKSGVILGSSGHLRVVVSANEATVDYVCTDRPVAHAYTIPSRSKP